ncbi:MAG: methylmalonyl Co-A mutase-associated GTPase MeaB [Rhodospirillaceae bacterium]|nr:methylmalonyl Co-A mutase-associated GTPase MeaB [Rhodospirillaceae bacterium]
MAETDATAELAAQLVAGDRRALARAITLIESTRADHRRQAESLSSTLLEHTGKSLRLGISGVPGVGKSTFIEAFGLHLIEAGHRVAVLAVDPSSPRTGGSILGDKTRMEELSRHTDAFIRPSPSGGTLGGVARRTREAMLCVEAAGFDVVLIETVGVGQSETAVAGLTDMFVLLLTPAGGDDLQGIKKGIVELADLIVVNKADGDLIPAAERARRDYAAALHLLRSPEGAWLPKVMKCSAMSGEGIADVWSSVEEFRTVAKASGIITRRRAEQAAAWMWDEITETLIAELKHDQRVQSEIERLESEVRDGTISPSQAARLILQQFTPHRINDGTKTSVL